MALPTCKICDSNVTAIGFGAMGIAAFQSTTIPEEQQMTMYTLVVMCDHPLVRDTQHESRGPELLDAVYESGCANWDTADAYNSSEVFICKWPKKTGERDEVFLATNFGLAAAILRRMVCADQEYVPKALDKSLEWLGVDRADLWYLHSFTLISPSPSQPTVRAMTEQVTDEKVKYLRLSGILAATLHRVHAVLLITAIQVEHSPLTLDIEDAKAADDPTHLWRSPEDLGTGDPRLQLPRFSKDNFSKVINVVDGIHVVAKNCYATLSQARLARFLAPGDDSISILGTMRILLTAATKCQ
ncbi:NADP-dependent oxidoreductase domain-containing protein [Trametes gibbosa]|nr:NADP-dependent oxidoreductase domain-containing protein [Trametes gibbosa]